MTLTRETIRQGVLEVLRDKLHCPAELLAEEKVIIGNVHAVLEPRCALMVGESAELLYCGIVQQIADAVEVFRHIVNLSA